MGCNNNKNPIKTGNEIKIKEDNQQEEEKTKSYEAKIVLLGDVSVGKTAIAARYCKKTFNDNHVNTIGGAYLQQKVMLENGTVVKLHVWDTSGQERFRAMTNLYYRDAQVAILTYDITNSSSFESLNFWIKELQYKVQNDNMILCLAGNKSDLADKRSVPTQKAKAFADENKMIFYETSAKNNEGVNQLFNDIAKKIVEIKNAISQ